MKYVLFLIIFFTGCKVFSNKKKIESNLSASHNYFIEQLTEPNIFKLSSYQLGSNSVFFETIELVRYNDSLIWVVYVDAIFKQQKSKVFLLESIPIHNNRFKVIDTIAQGSVGDTFKVTFPFSKSNIIISSPSINSILIK